MKITGTSGAIQRFQDLERRLKAAGLYNGPIDDDWGEGVDRGLDQLFAKAGIKAPAPQPQAPLDASGVRWPAGYEWVGRLDGLPRLTIAAGRLLGTRETPGPANSPIIMGWKAELQAAGVKNLAGYTADAVPWCGLGMAKIALDAGYVDEIPTFPLWALNWGDFGVKAKQPCLGSILTFVRDGGGHVGEYIAEDASAYHVIGCNQKDSVRIDRIAKSRLRGCREPAYNVRPAAARPFIVSSGGALSTNER